MPEHGWITVTAGKIDDNVHLTVENSGPPSEVPSLFEPFHRLPTTERLADAAESIPFWEDVRDKDPETGETGWTPYIVTTSMPPGAPGPVRFGDWPCVLKDGKQIGPVPRPARYRYACSAATALSP